MPEWLNELLIYAYWILFAIAHLAGLIVAIILLSRRKGTPAILAAVSFGLLFLQDVGQIVRRIFLDNSIQGMLGRGGVWEVSNCCCGLIELAALGCLVVAVYQAVSGPAASPDDESWGY